VARRYSAGSSFPSSSHDDLLIGATSIAVLIGLIADRTTLHGTSNDNWCYWPLILAPCGAHRGLAAVPRDAVAPEREQSAHESAAWNAEQ